MSDEVKYYALRENGKDVAIFTGKSPRQAALKAASKGKKNIELRERGKVPGKGWKVHIFKGERKQVPAPPGAPDWLGDKVWKSNVKKVGIKYITDI